MPDTKVGDLPSASPLTGTDVFYVVQAGNDKKATPAQIAAFIGKDVNGGTAATSLDKIQLRRDTEANWASTNPVLLIGEMGIATDTLAFKLGDGVTAWNSLFTYGTLIPKANSLTLNLIPPNGIPVTPASTEVVIYGSDIAGQACPSYLQPSGFYSPIQPTLFSKGISYVTPGTAATLSFIGPSNFFLAGTVTQGVLSSLGTIRTFSRRTTFTSLPAANSSAELRSTAPQCYVGTGAGTGGFFLGTRIGVTSLVASQALAVGLFSVTVALPGTTVPSNLNSCVFVGYDAGDTELHVMHNDTTLTCTKIPLGPSFPRLAANNVYEIVFFSSPTISAQIGYRVRNLTNGAVASGTLTSNIPVSIPLAYHAFLTNGSTGNNAVFDFYSAYLENEY